MKPNIILNLNFSQINSIAPGWVLFETFNPDLAIVELDRRVEFVQGLIGPICVPPTNEFKDKPSDAYVGGWGASHSDCDTNDFGPSPHTMCKLPFKYKGYKKFHPFNQGQWFLVACTTNAVKKFGREKKTCILAEKNEFEFFCLLWDSNQGTQWIAHKIPKYLTKIDIFLSLSL